MNSGLQGGSFSRQVSVAILRRQKLACKSLCQAAVAVAATADPIVRQKECSLTLSLRSSAI